MDHLFLLVNLADLSLLGDTGLGNPLILMICPDLGDEILGGSVGIKLDEASVVIQATPERCKAIREGIQLVGREKIGRPVRCKVRRTAPTRFAVTKIE